MAHCDKNTAVVDGAFNPVGSKGGMSMSMLIPYPLTPRKPGTLKPMLGVERYMDGSLVGAEGGCSICSLDEHYTSACPYKTHVPKNAIVGKRFVIVCKVCAGLFLGRCCNQDLGRARIRFCPACVKYGEHWSHDSHQCPQMMLGSRGSINIPGSSSGYLSGKNVSAVLRDES